MTADGVDAAVAGCWAPSRLVTLPAARMSATPAPPNHWYLCPAHMEEPSDEHAFFVSKAHKRMHLPAPPSAQGPRRRRRVPVLRRSPRRRRGGGAVILRWARGVRRGGGGAVVRVETGGVGVAFRPRGVTGRRRGPRHLTDRRRSSPP